MQHTKTKTQTAKVFKTGRSQAVRLPKEFRFAASEVFIWKDATTGDVILSSKDSGELIWKTILKEMGVLSQEERSVFPERGVIAAKHREPVF